MGYKIGNIFFFDKALTRTKNLKKWCLLLLETYCQIKVIVAPD